MGHPLKGKKTRVIINVGIIWEVMGIGSSIRKYLFGLPDDDGEGEGIIFRLGWKIIQLSIIAWCIVSIIDGEMPYIYGYNMFLWTGVLGLLILIALAALEEEEPKKDISVLDKEINEMKSKLDELEKEKTDQTIDYSEYNKKMDEQPPL